MFAVCFKYQALFLGLGFAVRTRRTCHLTLGLYIDYHMYILVFICTYVRCIWSLFYIVIVLSVLFRHPRVLQLWTHYCVPTDSWIYFIPDFSNQ